MTVVSVTAIQALCQGLRASECSYYLIHFYVGREVTKNVKLTRVRVCGCMPVHGRGYVYTHMRMEVKGQPAGGKELIP